MRELGARVTSKVADTSGSFIHLVGEQRSAYPRLPGCREAILPVLAEQAIERAGLIKYGQILKTIFRPIPIGEIRVAGPGPAGADPIGNAIGGQGIVIPAHIAFFRASPQKPAFAILAQATVAFSTGADETLVDTKIALLPRFILGGLCREMKRLSRLPMHRLNKGQELEEIGAKAIGAKLNRLGNEVRLPAATTAFDNCLGG